MKWFFHGKLNHELAIEEPSSSLQTLSTSSLTWREILFSKQNILWFIAKKKYKCDDFRMKQTKRWSLILVNEIMQFLTTRDFLTHQNCIAASLRRRYNTYTDQKCMAWCEDFFILCKIEFERDESAWKFDR